MMIIRATLVIALGHLFLRPVSGAIPSFGNQTASDSRSELADDDFLIMFRDSLQTIEDGQISRFASATTFPALGLPDVQIGINKVTLFSNKVYPAHTHPRASETLFVLKGEVDVVLALEGKKEKARVVKNFLTAGDTAIVPQGLPHSLKCVGRKSCNVLAFYNSADPGKTIGNAFEEL